MLLFTNYKTDFYQRRLIIIANGACVLLQDETKIKQAKIKKKDIKEDWYIV